jgi:predicted membrane channel-forming protein YqfA (hemolysin III family)
MNLKLFHLPFKIFSSMAFLLWITGAWLIFYIVTAIWMKEAFGFFIASLRQNPFMQVPFILFLLAGYMNLIRAGKPVFQKSKLQFFLWLILPVGALLFFTGFFMSATMRESGQRFLGAGDVIDPPWTKEKLRIVSIDPGLKDRLTDKEAASGIFAYEPKLTVLDRNSRSFKIGAFPPAKFNNTYYHILNFGIAPGVRLFEGSSIRSEGHMILRIITPGSSDFFDIPPYPYRFLVSMDPEKTVQRRQGTASRFNLKDPRFSVRVFKGETVIAEGDPAKGIKIDNLSLFFFRPTFWIQLEAVKDPGIAVMHAGVILITFGFPISLMRVALLLLKR